ncbi:DUF4328 domain-containing protein [Streptomyces sp. DT24]|uniref:DUF4328 domain-containing protein n=1 Tax=Streptomyces sp. DT24 TaxID=3416520 RepID=UPI003CECB42A
MPPPHAQSHPQPYPQSFGYAPTGPAGAVLSSPVGIGKAVVALLGAVIVADLLSVAAGFNIRQVLNDVLDHGYTTGDESRAARADDFYAATGVFQLLALFATAVLFLIWFRRTRLNAEVFDPSVQPMRPGWAIGGWFVPVAGLWLPRRIAGGIWTVSDRANVDGSGRAASTAPMNLWWGAWICALLFSQYASRRYDRAEGADELVRAAGQLMISDALDIVAAVLAIVFVRKLTRMQTERAALGPLPHAEFPPR